MIITEYSINAPVRTQTAAVVADLHDRPFPDIQKELDKRKPDLILIPGDLTSWCYAEETHWRRGYRGKYHPPEEALAFLRYAASLAPCYYSRGNHEWWMAAEDIDIVRQTGVHFVDKSFVADGGLVIGGMPSAYGFGLTYQKHAVPELDWLDDFEKVPGYHILLSHNPEYWPRYLRNRNIELTISGHAHGGQWRIAGHGIYAPGQGLFPKYTHGLYDNGRFLVSAGLTNTQRLIPRIGNPTELVFIHFENASFCS